MLHVFEKNLQKPIRLSRLTERTFVPALDADYRSVH